MFGFKKKSHPLIFFSNGDYIGDKEEYFKLIKNNFNLPSLFNVDCKFSINDEIVKNLTLEHIDEVNKEYIIHKQGLTIRDRIEEKLAKLSSSDIRTSEINNRYNTLDTEYSKDFIGDMKIFYKINQKFSPSVDEHLYQENPLEENKILVEIVPEKSKQVNLPAGSISIKSRKSMKENNIQPEYSDEEEENKPKSTNNIL